MNKESLPKLEVENQMPIKIQLVVGVDKKVHKKFCKTKDLPSQKYANKMLQVQYI